MCKVDFISLQTTSILYIKAYQSPKMAGSPVLIELSDSLEATGDLFNFPFSDPTIILGDTETEASSPICPRPYSNTANQTALHNVAPSASDPFEIPTPQAEFSASSHRHIQPNRKRGSIDPISNPTNKTRRVSPQETNKSPRELILNARDLIV